MTQAQPSSEASLRARVAAFSLHSQVDSREHTKPARAAAMLRFETQVDPNGELPRRERLRRAECLRKAYFAKLALKSAQARRRKRGRKARAS